jgi:hypothetical protein
MLDLISNILSVVYTTGTFWGGGYKGGGAHQNNVFADLNIFKVNGGFTDYMDAFVKEATSGPSNVLSVKEVAIDTDYPTLRRMVSGAIKIIASGVGFVENCFVPSRLIQQCGLTNGQTIKVTAIRTYDRKKSALSWTVVKIE